MRQAETTRQQGIDSDPPGQRHWHQEFLAFLKRVARTHAGQQLHLVTDSFATHKTPEVKARLAKNPRFQVYFTPTSASWLNLVEVWFSIIERQALHRADVASVPQLNARIRAFATGWNDRCHPFVWTRTSTEILKKASRPTTSKTALQETDSCHWHHGFSAQLSDPGDWITGIG